MMRRVLIGLVLAATFSARAENWPRFRGPNGQGISSESNLPATWSATENIAWKTPIAAQGWSSPIVWGERIFLTGTTDRGVSCHVVCLSTSDGKVLWDKKVFEQQTTRKEGKNSYATPTPVTDGQSVYGVFGSGGIVALDFAGNILWTNTENKFYSRHGLGSSPIIYKDLLVIPWDWSIVPGPGIEEKVGWQIPWDKGFVLALDRKTGKEKWRTGRGSSRISHMTPIVASIGGKDQIISPAGDAIQGFDPESGALLWTVKSGGEGVVPSPVLAGADLLVTLSGFPTNVPGGTAIRAVRLDPKARGDVTGTHIAWEQRRNVPHLPSMVYHAPSDLLFGVRENGFGLCVKARTGEIVWHERLGGNFSASPVLAENRVYLLAESGETVVVEASERFKEIARNRLGDGQGPVQASMAIADGKLYIRSARQLWCIGGK
jgi:outer membrane protein assembly factor BamB